MEPRTEKNLSRETDVWKISGGNYLGGLKNNRKWLPHRLTSGVNLFALKKRICDGWHWLPQEKGWWRWTPPGIKSNANPLKNNRKWLPHRLTSGVNLFALKKRICDGWHWLLMHCKIIGNPNIYSRYTIYTSKYSRIIILTERLSLLSGNEVHALSPCSFSHFEQFSASFLLIFCPYHLTAQAILR